MDPTAVPTGNSSSATQAYYQYLYSHYYSAIPADRTQILWNGPIWIAVFAFFLIVFFFFYAYFLKNAHRKSGELYEATSFAGSILERIGPVSIFSWFLIILFTAWSIYYIVVQILHGQIY